MEALVLRAIQHVVRAGRGAQLNERQCERFLSRVEESQDSVLNAARAFSLSKQHSVALRKLAALYTEVAEFMAESLHPPQHLVG